MTFFTREYGLISALCRGGRTPKKQAMLQPFTPIWIVINEVRGFYYVNQIEIKSATLNLIGTNLLSGLYLNELIYKSLSLEDVAEELYNTYTLSLFNLVKSSDKLSIERVLRNFEMILLDTIGYSIIWTHIADLNQPVLEDKFYTYKAGVGFVLSDIGVPGRHLLSASQNNLDNEVLLSVKIIMRQALHHALDGVCFHTRNLYI